MKYIYYSFSVTKLQKSKEKSLNLKSYINRIFTPESITLHENYDAKIMTCREKPYLVYYYTKVSEL